MDTKIVEATNSQDGGKTQFNWGKFMVGKFSHDEWAHRSNAPGIEDMPLIRNLGWGTDHAWVLDLQTGEGALFGIGGLARADHKHKVWVCPLFEPFLTWLYANWDGDLDHLPGHVALSYKEAPPSMGGYRRGGA